MNLTTLKLFDGQARSSTSIEKYYACLAPQNHKISLPNEFDAQNNVLIRLFSKEAAVVNFNVLELLKFRSAQDQEKMSINNLT
jgi:hypothetical protein